MVTQAQKAKMYEQIKNHGEKLIEFFRLPEGTDPIELCKKLRMIETKVHHATTCLCNTNTLHLLELNRFTGYDVKQTTEEEEEKFFDGILKRLEKVLGKENAGKCFINHDPRGYALKIKADETANFYYKDWGSYGILAPDFTPTEQ